MSDRRSWLQICLSIVSALILVYGCYVVVAAIINVARWEPGTPSPWNSDSYTPSNQDPKIFWLEFGMYRGALTIMVSLVGFAVVRFLDSFEKFERTLTGISKELAQLNSKQP